MARARGGVYTISVAETVEVMDRTLAEGAAREH